MTREVGGPVTYNGILETREVQVRAEVGGKVMALYKDEGDPVKEGEVICELDREKLALQLRGGEGQLTAQKAKLEAMQKGARTQEIAQVKAVLNAARTQREKAEKDYGRIERLYATSDVSEYERDSARTMRDLAAEQERRADQAYQLVLAGVRDEELKAQLAIVDAAQAQVDYYQVQLDDALVQSPLTGRVVERYVEPGELTMPVTDYKRLEVKVYVPEEPMGRIRLGQRAAVTVDSFPGRPFDGWVSSKSEQWEFTPKNVQTKEERSTLVFEVTLQVENPDEQAIAGLPADVSFLPGIKEGYAGSAEKAPAAAAMPGETVAP
jgi:HlyD family secretion protein